MSVIDDLWNFVIEQLNKIIRFVNSVSIRLTDSLNNLINFVNRIYDNVMREIRGLWAWIDYLKGQIVTGVSNAVAAAINYAKEGVMSVVRTIQTQISNIYENINNIYNWTNRQIATVQTLLLNKIQDAFDRLTERMNKVEQAVGKVPDMLSIQNKILDWVFVAIEKAWR
jgi:phage-related protein